MTKISIISKIFDLLVNDLKLIDQIDTHINSEHIEIYNKTHNLICKIHYLVNEIIFSIMYMDRNSEIITNILSNKIFHDRKIEIRYFT